jgi:DNA repair protein RecO (recombination protein O)
MAEVRLQPAWVLHQRDYRDTSLLLEVLTAEHGRIGLVARGVRGKRSNTRALLQPYRALLLSWTGRGELHTLTGVEEAEAYRPLIGERLLCGYYLNELLIRLLHRDDPVEGVCDLYAQAIGELRGELASEVILRRFELALLELLGYAPPLDCTAEGEPVEAEHDYGYLPEHGPQALAGHRFSVSGRTLLALAAGQLEDPRVLREAKLLLRMILRPYLGDKPLKSRELFRQLQPPKQSHD